MNCSQSRPTVSRLRQTYLEISKYCRKHGIALDSRSELGYRQTHNLSSPLRTYNARSGSRSYTTAFRCSQRTSSHYTKCPIQSRQCLLSTRRSVRAYSADSKNTGIEDVIARFQASDIGATASTYDWTKLETCDAQSSNSPDPINIHGYVTAHRTGKKVDFLTVVDPYLQRAIQVVCPRSALVSESRQDPGVGSTKDDGLNRSIKPHTPVLVTGTIAKCEKPPAGMSEGSDTFETIDQHVGKVRRIGHVEIQASSIETLNEFPSHLVAKHDTNFPPEKRFLQFRTDASLRSSIHLRSRVKAACMSFLLQKGFDEVETPLLFKSTPEGAREFVVPTRRKGLAYALPQSPQQYKQVLMASGVPRYFQFARCFRDEDLRADRQPEFTQLDLEMSFANRETIMSTIEELLLEVIWPSVGRFEKLPVGIQQISRHSKKSVEASGSVPQLPIFTYEEVMANYGSDKPDPRLGAKIVRINEWVPTQFKSMLTDLEDPIIEMIQIKTKDQDSSKSKQFVSSFMDLSSSETYLKGRFGMAGISIYDPTKPLSGLAAFGHEGASRVEEDFEPEEGDILVVQARPDQPFSGGSTVLGDMRRDMLRFAVEQGLVEAPSTDSLFWVVDFPLFSPIEEDAPGQEGQAGICSTHHPFTAPRNDQDLSKLLKDPLSVVGDHYDLVINGTEVGGGSRRIHHPRMQELVFRDVLKMKSERIEDFRHLLDALEAGCPPHAGIALGFDRLMTLLLDKSSVREVIAFPKWGDGEDKFVGSPSPLTPSQLNTYHLEIVDTPDAQSEPRLSIKA